MWRTMDGLANKAAAEWAGPCSDEVEGWQGGGDRRRWWRHWGLGLGLGLCRRQRHRVGGRPTNDETISDNVAQPTRNPDPLEGGDGVIASIVAALALLCPSHVRVALLCQL